MKKIDLLIGILIGFTTTFIGIIIFFEFFTAYSFSEGIQSMKQLGYLGKVITLGAILNIVVFFGLLQFNKELMARGVVLATILLTIITMLV